MTTSEEADERISLDGQVAIVTGAGGGLGRTYAVQLAERGAAVVVNDISTEAADAVVSEITGAGGRAVAAYDSVGTPEGCAAVVEAAVSTFGTVDTIIHNAGSWSNAYMGDMTPERVDAVLDVHLRGAFFLVHSAWQTMIDKGYGRIVLTSSSAGAWGREMGANYVAAKAGLLGLTRALAIEGERHGIKANAILPNAAVNRFWAPDPKNLARRGRQSEVVATIAPRRKTEMVSTFVTYLASPQCDVNGEAYSVGAGHFGRVFIGVTDGWATQANEAPSPEEVRRHIAEIRDRTRYVVPESNLDEMVHLTARLRSIKAEGLAD
jgi:NAD(P)-dependent dehydrogenase (short-subunit alcohol dehydrogenase family)